MTRDTEGVVPALSLAVLRERAREAVEQSGERSVARAIDISPRALHLFILGQGAPRATTVRKIRGWYMRAAAERDTEVPETYGAAVALLTPWIPPGQRQAAQRRVLECVCEQYRAQGIPVPPGILVLLQQLRTGKPLWSERSMSG